MRQNCRLTDKRQWTLLEVVENCVRIDHYFGVQIAENDIIHLQACLTQSSSMLKDPE